MRGKVDKLIYPFTGPRLITAKLNGASYEIEHVATKRKDKKRTSDLSPYPLELIAFQPLDGADNQYGQINQNIINQPYKEAGIKGFTPPNPFKVATNFAATNDSLSFKWPTMAELNEELFPYPWSCNEEFSKFLSDELSSTIVPGFYTGPPPFAPKCTTPTIPPAAILAQQLIKSSDKLVFISNLIGSGDMREWRIVRVAFQASMVSYSSCLVEVDFYISYPSSSCYNAINKRFWLQYYSQDDIMANSTSANTHLIRPSDSSETYASRHKLLHFRKYINLTHSDTFIHGPFDFSTINNRKSWDIICQSDWDILKFHCDLYHNSLPRFDVSTYSVHIDAGAHTTFYSAALSGDLFSSAQCTLHTPH